MNVDGIKKLKRPKFNGSVNDDLLDHFDLGAQVLCWQISEDNLQFIRNFVLPQLGLPKSIRFREIRILVALVRLDARSLNELSDIVRTNARAVKTGVDRLIGLKFVELVENTSDKRAYTLSATKKGRAFEAHYKYICRQAIIAAEEWMQVRTTQKLRKQGFSTLYWLKDRTDSLRDYDSDKPRRHKRGQGKVMPIKDIPQGLFRYQADFVFQIFAEQISQDYLAFLKQRVLPRLESDILEGIGIRELRLLLAVSFYRDPLTAADLGSVLRMDRATLSRGFARLTEAGFIKWAPDEEDARRRLAFTTVRGEALAQKYRQVSKEVFTQVEEGCQMPSAWNLKAIRLADLIVIKSRSEALARLRPIYENAKVRSENPTQ